MYNITLVIHIYMYWEKLRKYTMVDQTSLGYLGWQLNHISDFLAVRWTTCWVLANEVRSDVHHFQASRTDFQHIMCFSALPSSQLECDIDTQYALWNHMAEMELPLPAWVTEWLCGAEAHPTQHTDIWNWLWYKPERNCWTLCSGAY